MPKQLTSFSHEAALNAERLVSREQSKFLPKIVVAGDLNETEPAFLEFSSELISGNPERGVHCQKTDNEWTAISLLGSKISATVLCMSLAAAERTKALAAAHGIDALFLFARSQKEHLSVISLSNGVTVQVEVQNTKTRHVNKTPHEEYQNV